VIDFDAIQKQRSFRTVTMSVDMPGSAADLVEGLLARFQADPDKLAIVQEMILVEGAKAVLAQLGGEDKPVQTRRGRKPKLAAVTAQPVAATVEERRPLE
jgi:hypothetical protein